jgi:hypothetical protein
LRKSATTDISGRMRLVVLAFILLMPRALLANPSDWSAYSIIEKQEDGKAFKESVYLVNSSTRTIRLSMPAFQFDGHDDTPAENIGMMEDLALAPAEAVRFVHIIPIDRKNGFASEIGILDVAEGIPIKQFKLKADMGPQR